MGLLNISCHGGVLSKCVVSPSLPQKHLSQCSFATALCPQCQESVRISHLDEHKSQHCLQRLMTCPACAGSFVYANKQVKGEPRFPVCILETLRSNYKTIVWFLWLKFMLFKTRFNSFKLYLNTCFLLCRFMNRFVLSPIQCVNIAKWSSFGIRYVTMLSTRGKTVIDSLWYFVQYGTEAEWIYFCWFQLALHCDTDCLKAPVACTFITFGCREKVGHFIA